MSRVAKMPQYDDFNLRTNCYGKHQTHTGSLGDWLDGATDLILEVGAGSARVALEAARQNPGRRIVAIDQKSNRLLKAAKVAEVEGLTNIAFAQTDLRDLEGIADLGSRVACIWVTFPDPYPRDRQEKHRLTHASMLDIYHGLLTDDGALEFKTDNSDLYTYSLDALQSSDLFDVVVYTDDLHASNIDDPVALTLTTYEKMFLLEGLTTKYIKSLKL